MKVDDLEAAEATEAFLADGLKRVSSEDELFELRETPDELVRKFLDVVVGQI